DGRGFPVGDTAWVVRSWHFPAHRRDPDRFGWVGTRQDQEEPPYVNHHQVRRTPSSTAPSNHSQPRLDDGTSTCCPQDWQVVSRSWSRAALYAGSMLSWRRYV